MRKNLFSFINILFFTALFLTIIPLTYGAQYQTTASKTTAVGTVAGGASGPIGTYADSLAKAIIKVCPATSTPIPGYALVNSPAFCLQQINNTSDAVLKTATLRDTVAALDGSAKQFGNLQCVGFANAVAGGTGKILPPGQANAIDFAHDFSSQGYKWFPVGQGTVQSGDFAVWYPNHIAVVINVPNPDHIMVAEANGGSGSVGEETYPSTNVNFHGNYYQGFLRRQ